MLNYFKFNRQRIERIILNRRSTIVFKTLTEEADDEKMYRALRANIIHCFDGYIVRRITVRLVDPIMTIHDSFGIDILRINLLLRVVREELSELAKLELFEIPKIKDKTLLSVTSNFVLL